MLDEREQIEMYERRKAVADVKAQFALMAKD